MSTTFWNLYIRGYTQSVNKTKADLLQWFDNPNYDKNSKVYNRFLQIFIKHNNDHTVILKADFMNEAMGCYSMNKFEVDSLVRTYENLNKDQKYTQNKSAIKVSRNPWLSDSYKDVSHSSKPKSSNLLDLSMLIKFLFLVIFVVNICSIGSKQFPKYMQNNKTPSSLSSK